MADWDKRFLDVSKLVASWSKDTSRGVGAVIANKHHRIVSVGYNGLPTGANDEIKTRYERPQKYLYTEHAERNAIYNAARAGSSTEGCIMYLEWFPCADCARAIIQSGIKTLVCTKPSNDSKWKEHFEIAQELLEECGVEIRFRHV